jgi:hypothetical protein
MKIGEIQQLELGNDKSCFLIKDGIFWRAYEKSAMFFVQQIKNYQLTRKYFKNIGTEMVYLGFPDKALNDVLALCTAKEFEVRQNNEMLEIAGFDYHEGFDSWKKTVEKTEPSTVSEESVEYNTVSGTVFRKILDFPLAERTPLDCQNFILELKNTINGTV